MARLSLYLPPFAGDYSGACSTLFGLDCLVIVVDAGCCTRNYAEYDEPRWARRRKTAFSAQLRTLEAALGDDARIVEQAADAAREFGSACIAIVGTPVPAITGMDLKGIAREVESRCGIPALGIETGGFETYERGASKALEALVRRFALDAAAAPSFAGARAGRPRVNVLGLSPHDFLGEADVAMCLAWLADAGLDVSFAAGSSYTLADVAAARSADASVVVAWSGLAAARLLERAAGVPYVVCRPWCAADAVRVADAVRTGLAGPVGLQGAAPPVPPGAAMLLVGEQVAMSCLRAYVRDALAAGGAPRPVTVASLFSCEAALSEPGDFHADGEADLIAWARGHPGFSYVGDPLLARLPGFGDALRVEVPHEALSSTLFADAATSLAGEGVLAALSGLTRGPSSG